MWGSWEPFNIGDSFTIFIECFKVDFVCRMTHHYMMVHPIFKAKPKFIDVEFLIYHGYVDLIWDAFASRTELAIQGITLRFWVAFVSLWGRFQPFQPWFGFGIAHFHHLVSEYAGNVCGRIFFKRGSPQKVMKTHWCSYRMSLKWTPFKGGDWCSYV